MPVDQKVPVLFSVWPMELVFVDGLVLKFGFLVGVAFEVELLVELLLG